MRDDTSEATVGLLKIMDDIAASRAASRLPQPPAPSIAVGGYRVLGATSEHPRPSRVGTLRPSVAKPKHMRGFLTALFAGGLGLAVLAGPVTCPTCDPVRSHGETDAKRIQSRLTYSPGEVVDAAARETTTAAETEAVAEPARTDPPPAQLALIEPQESTSPISTATIDSAPTRQPEVAPATATEPTPSGAAKLPEKIEELSAKAPETEIAAATVESEPEAPLPSVSATTLPMKDVAVDPEEEPAPRAHTPRKHLQIKQRAPNKARVPGPRSGTTSPPKLYSPNKYAQVPGWAAKMFENPWQSRAFSFQ